MDVKSFALGYNAGASKSGGNVTQAELEAAIKEVVPEWALAEEPPKDAVTSVNGKTGAVNLIIPSEASDVKADPVGTAERETSALRDEVNVMLADYDKSSAVNGKIYTHNTSAEAHQDLRVELQILADRLNAALNSTDTSLDDLKEIVAYIKSNKTLIDAITAAKVNVTDIVNNLVTNRSDRPLSAAQGAFLKALIDALTTTVDGKTNAEQVRAAINAALSSYLTAAKADELYQPKGNYQPAGNYVVAEAGKGLSTNDFTNADKEKLSKAMTELSEEDKAEIAASFADELSKPIIGVNKYDEETMSSQILDAQHRLGTVPLPETDEGYQLVISCKGTSHGSYIYRPSQNTGTIGVYKADGTKIDSVSFSDTIRDTPTNRSGLRVTIPAGVGAAILKFTYRIATASSILCQEMMVTIGSTFVAYEPYKETYLLSDLGLLSASEADEMYAPKRCYYVAANGSDDNDGLSADNPLASIRQALLLGAREIAVKAGDYYITEAVTIEGINNLRIYAYRDAEEWTTSNTIRAKANFIGAQYVTGYTKNSDGVYQKSSVSGGFDYTAVFTNKSKNPTVTERTYHANLMVIHNDTSKDYYLKPVLTYAECKSTANSFFWDGSTLSFNPATTDFTNVAVIKSEEGLVIERCNNVTINDICVKLVKGDVVTVEDCDGVTLNNCEANASACYMGFALTNANAVLNNCYATKNGYDGFNFHGFGTTVMNDCTAENNYDDGCSHHDGCIGTINGGYFGGSGKAGIAPAYGAIVNIYGVVAENNHIGIGYMSTGNGHPAMKGIVSNCLMIGNGTGLIVDPLCTVFAVNCKYSGNTTDKAVDGTIKEH